MSRTHRAFPHGMARAAQVIKGQLDIRVIDRPLENLAVHLKDGGPDWFGLLKRLADRSLKGIAFDRALDPDERPPLPPRAGVTRFLRKPYVQLRARQRKRAVIKLHRTPRPQ